MTSPAIKRLQHKAQSVAVQLDHSYSVESPRFLKQKLNILVNRLEKKKRQLINGRKREKRSRQTIQKLLTEVKNLQLLSDEAQQQLSVYSSMLKFL
jgi:phosphoenolpyruvate synthase/pyruvate phosphate dikinase